MRERIFWLILSTILVVAAVTSGFILWGEQSRFAEISGQISNLSSELQNCQTAPTTPAAKIYLDCQTKNILEGADAELDCTDQNGQETQIIKSLISTFNISPGIYISVTSTRFFPVTQTVLFDFASEADIKNFGFKYYNLKTGAAGSFPGQTTINQDESLFFSTARFSPTGRYAVVGGANYADPSYFFQTLYVFDLQELKLVTKISAPANTTFLYQTDCFRTFDIDVNWTSDAKFRYGTYEKTTPAMDKDGLCSFAAKSTGPQKGFQIQQ